MSLFHFLKHFLLLLPKIPCRYGHGDFSDTAYVSHVTDLSVFQLNQVDVVQYTPLYIKQTLAVFIAWLFPMYLNSFPLIPVYSHGKLPTLNIPWNLQP